MRWSQAISGNSHYSAVLWLSAHEVDFVGGELKFHNGSRPQSARRRPWLSVAPAAVTLTLTLTLTRTRTLTLTLTLILTLPAQDSPLTR